MTSRSTPPRQIVFEPSLCSVSDTPPTVLTIAGSDSGGGAGIQADIKTFAALQTVGTSAVTALTAQNTVGVSAVHVAPPELVERQIRVVLDDLAPRSVKTGMLATSEIIELVAAFAQEGLLPNLVVDPVMIATSGDRLLTEKAERFYAEQLFPHAAVITPNAVEAGHLCGRTLRSIGDLHTAAKQLGSSGADYVVIKGGHIDGSQSVDVVWDGVESLELISPRFDTVNTHGTGCSFAAAIAAELAKGSPTLDAILTAKRYIGDAIYGAKDWKVGQGHGPVDHSIQIR